jgi:hypothetical protein
MTIYNQNNLLQVTDGTRLGNINALINAIKNLNGCTTAYQITATAAGVQLSSVINEVDTTPPGSGVILPPTSGTVIVPFQLCVVINNTATALQIYATTDTINNTAGATGISQAANTNSLYVSAQKGAWFSISGGSGGGSAGTGQIVTSTNPLTLTAAIFNNQIALITPALMAVTVDPTVLTPYTPYTVKDAAGNAGAFNITITPTSGTFDGQANFIIFQNYGSVSFYSDATNIWVYQ